MTDLPPMPMAERLRDACADVRRKSYPISDLVPLMQEAADELDKARAAVLAERERLQAENQKLRTVMIAAAEEIHAHWEAHCDAEGYGPQNLMRRLEEGIPSEYGYTAGAFAQLKDEKRDAVLAEREACAQEFDIRDKGTGGFYDPEEPAQIIRARTTGGTKPPPAQMAEWSHLKRYGYAPGNYMSTCHRCQQVVTGVDKRASTCRPCAEAMDAGSGARTTGGAA